MSRAQPQLEPAAGSFTASLEAGLERVPGAAVIAARRLPESPPAAAPSRLPRWLAARLRAQGIERLRPHQAQAVTLGRAGRHFALSSPTASGKSLCYMIPVAAALGADPDATALYISPAKALAQQQLQRFQALVPTIAADLYDGDTPRERRAAIRAGARLIMTNPDMLHVGILPYHGGWERFFAHLRFVVLDEAHSYTGAFGSHVTWILRRLRRVAEYHGARPAFILLSATIGNPAGHAEALIGQQVPVIQGTAAGLGARHMILVDSGSLGSNRVAVELFAALVGAEHRSLLFGGTRQGVESLTRLARQLVGARAVASYRSGYQPEERRALEADLFSGRLDGMVATNALELGIDVGSLDAVVLAGFPGSVAAMWQQLGRAGRGGKPSLAVVVLGDSLLERHYATHPEALFAAPVEAAVVNPDNPFIAEQQNRAAQWELPGPGRGEGTSPAMTCSIRGAGARFRLVVGGRVIEETDERHALTECHPGAVYLSGSRTYLVEGWEGRDILLREAHDLTYQTTPLRTITVQCNRPLGVGAGHGRVRILTAVEGFRRVDMRTRHVLDTIPLRLPPAVMETDALWLVLPRSLNVFPHGLAESLHAAEHVLAGLMPTVVMADPRDIEGTSYARHPEAGDRAAIFLYDDVAGGVGYCTSGHEGLQRLLASALDAVTECRCRDGCPSCIQRASCRSLDPLTKEGAVRVLRALTTVLVAEHPASLGHQPRT